MKELSLNILDIAMNSVKADARNIEILLDEKENHLQLSISDDGYGMSRERLAEVMDPFFTTRTTRSVGMGIPLLKLAAEQTGGSISVTSSDREDHGTVTSADFYTDHVDCMPLGDVISTVVTLIQGSPDLEWHFRHCKDDREVDLDTKELRAVLGDIPLDSYEVMKWIEDYLKEGYQSILE